MALIQTAVILMAATLALAQRPFFAGLRPIGYPEIITTTSANDLGNRFNEDATTQRLPIEALGDKALVDRLSKLPIDKQPFWFINWQALEAQRQNPQTFEQRPSSFNNQLVPNQNSGAAISAGTNVNSGIAVNDPLVNRNGETNQNTQTPEPVKVSGSVTPSNTNSDKSTSMSQSGISNSNLGNRFSEVSSASNSGINQAATKKPSSGPSSGSQYGSHHVQRYPQNPSNEDRDEDYFGHSLFYI